MIFSASTFCVHHSAWPVELYPEQAPFSFNGNDALVLSDNFADSFRLNRCRVLDHRIVFDRFESGKGRCHCQHAATERRPESVLVDVRGNSVSG